MSSVGLDATPCLLLERSRLEANCARMREAVRRRGARLRPHLKTAKCVEVARLALGDTADGLTVATLDEAAYFVERGFRDLTYAVGITPDKLPRVAKLQRQGATVSLLTDDVGAARAIGRAARELDARLSVYIEIDSGQHRGGVAPEGPQLLPIARALHEAPGVELAGVLTHAGHSYGCRGTDAIAEVAEAERAAAVRASERLRAAGLPCPEVSVGSTPTALCARDLSGVTEVRAGVYVFFDLFQHAIGVCRRDELALSVLSSVVSRREDQGCVWIDAGTLALSSERSLDAVGGRGYGQVTAADGSPLAGAPIVDRLNQEHGRVVATAPAGLELASLPVGARVRVWPNHACITAAMFDRYHVLCDGEPVDTWPRLKG